MKKLLAFCLTVLLFASCGTHSRQSQTQSDDNQLSVTQERLRAQGWKFVIPKGGEMGEEYGIVSKYGTQDNYFDIQVGDGYDVVVKIVDIATDRCVRCVYVPHCDEHLQG